MTQMTLLWPYVPGLLRDTYENGDQSGFSEYDWRYNGPNAIKQGPDLFAGGSYASAAFQYTAQDITDVGDSDVNEVVFRLVVDPGGGAQHVRACLRVPNTWENQSHLPDNCIFAQWVGDGDLEIRRVTGVSTTALIADIADAAAQLANGFPAMIRFHADSSAPTNIKVKIWSDVDPEPASWHLETTDASVAASGIPLMARVNSTGAGYFSHVSFGLGEVAPSIYGSISGNVFVSPTTGVARTVRAVSRTDPLVAFETTSAGDGSYSLQALLGHTYTVYSMDDSYNAAIADRVVPINPDA